MFLRPNGFVLWLVLLVHVLKVVYGVFESCARDDCCDLRFFLGFPVGHAVGQLVS